MFIAFDESISGSYTVLGCVCLPEDKLSKLEASTVKCRLKNNLWGEVKWNKITKGYFGKYKDYLSCYLADEDVTFHSWAYENPTPDEIASYWEDSLSVFYKQSYMLLRSVIWKCLNYGCENKFYILVDTTGCRGEREYKITAGLLQGDPKISPLPKFEFCKQGNSLICNAMQVADVCTGAVRFLYEKVSGDSSISDEMVDFFQDLNGKIPLNFSPRRLPKLKEYKFSHCLFDKAKAG